VGPDGALGFTQAHSASIPSGSLQQGFSREQANDNAPVYLKFEGRSFYLCPVPVTAKSYPQEPAYQVFVLAEAPKNCKKTKIETVAPGDGKVWQYV
jgi:hypothetical protein